MTLNIIFDADDTLWETEFLYDEARQQAVDRLVQAGIGNHLEIDKLARKIDGENFKKLRFSKERFPKSLADTYKALCKTKKKTVDPKLVDDIISIGSSVFKRQARRIERVASALEVLKSKDCRLIMWTQGDIDVQNKRIQESNLKAFFGDNIEITDSKSSETLEALLKKHHIDPKNTWLVGNSIKSDINPALEKQLRAIWIPNHVWDREHDALNISPSSGELAYQADNIGEVPKIILRADNDKEIERQTNSKDSVVYLFVSAYQDLYRQYVLDILAYPRGFIFRFPYDTNRWLPLPYRNNPKRQEEFAALLENKDALIVFVDERTETEPRRNQRFIPIRAGKINKQALVSGGMLHIEFKLGDYVIYDNDNVVDRYDETIKALEARPKPNIEDCAYISIGPTYKGRISTQDDPKHDDDAWQTIIHKLGRLNSIQRKDGQNRFTPIPIDPFEKAMFFRICGLEELPSKRDVQLKTFLDDESGYEIDNSKNYRLNLLFYSPKRPHSAVRRSKVRAEIGSEFIHGVGKLDIPLNFRYDRRHIDLLTDRVFTDIWSSISLSAASRLESNTKESDQIVTPEPVLLVKIRATRWVNIAAPILFAIATIVSSLNVQFAEFITVANPKLGQFEDQISAALAVIGSSASTVLLFYLYRKLK